MEAYELHVYETEVKRTYLDKRIYEKLSYFCGRHAAHEPCSTILGFHEVFDSSLLFDFCSSSFRISLLGTLPSISELSSTVDDPIIRVFCIGTMSVGTSTTSEVNFCVLDFGTMENDQREMQREKYDHRTEYKSPYRYSLI